MVLSIEERVDDHEDRIRVMERDFPVLQTEVKNLIKSLGTLTSWIKALVIALITGMIGFGFWVAQFVIERVVM